MMGIWILSCMLLMTACGSGEKADKIYMNGNIWTGVENASRAEFIAVLGESILKVGGGNYSDFQGPNTELIELHGNFVVPGFMDSHTHFMSGGLQLMSINLRDAKSKKAV